MPFCFSCIFELVHRPNVHRSASLQWKPCTKSFEFGWNQIGVKLIKRFNCQLAAWKLCFQLGHSLQFSPFKLDKNGPDENEWRVRERFCHFPTGQGRCAPTRKRERKTNARIRFNPIDWKSVGIRISNNCTQKIQDGTAVTARVHFPFEFTACYPVRRGAYVGSISLLHGGTAERRMYFSFLLSFHSSPVVFVIYSIPITDGLVSVNHSLWPQHTTTRTQKKRSAARRHRAK